MAKSTNKVEFEQGAISIDAAIIAEGLGIEPELVQSLMREGKISSLSERGIGKDEGRHRITLFFGKRCFRLLVDDKGKIIERSTTDSDSKKR